MRVYPFHKCRLKFLICTSLKTMKENVGNVITSTSYRPMCFYDKAALSYKSSLST